LTNVLLGSGLDFHDLQVLSAAPRRSEAIAQAGPFAVPAGNAAETSLRPRPHFPDHGAMPVRIDMSNPLLGDDRRVGALASAAVMALAAVARRGVPQWDNDAFLEINGLPDALYGPVWPVMQLGSLASVGITAGLTRRLGRRPPRATTVALAGGAAWLACKPVKRLVGRPRPDPATTRVKVRGAAQTGLGYPSGHAAVAAAMGAVLAKGASRRRRSGIALLAGTVGASRVYIGAHYPLDVLGGWAAGLAMAALVRSLRR
jgi:membrane-associated phospholipid phosphatase